MRILEKEMATHCSIRAWRILWTEEPGGLQSMESQRVGHDWAINAHEDISQDPGGAVTWRQSQILEGPCQPEFPNTNPPWT